MYNETTGVVTSDKSISNVRANFIFQNIDKILLGGYMQAVFSVVWRARLIRAPSDLSSDQSSSGAKTDSNFSKSYMQFLRIQQIAEDLITNFRFYAIIK